MIIPNTNLRRWKNRAVILVMALMVGVCLTPLASLMWTLLRNGLGALDYDFLTSLPAPVGERGGIANAIIGSFLLLVLACISSVPLGILIGLFLSQRSGSYLAMIARVLLDAMTGIPAIVIGVFIYAVVVLPSKHFSMLAGALALGMLMLPITARTTEEAVRAVPSTFYEAGLALGLPRRRVVLRIMLRSAVPAVLTGLFLAVSRVAGEAAPLLFTSFGSPDWPRSANQPTASLPLMLFTYSTSPFDEWHRQAWGMALVLIAMILGVRILTHVFSRRPSGGRGH